MNAFQIGDKIRYSYPLKGEFYHRVIAESHLMVKNRYRVKDTTSGTHGQLVRLCGHGRTWFCSDLFKLIRNGTPEEIQRIEAIAEKKKAKKQAIRQTYSPFITAWMESAGIAEIRA